MPTDSLSRHSYSWSSKLLQGSVRLLSVYSALNGMFYAMGTPSSTDISFASPSPLGLNHWNELTPMCVMQDQSFYTSIHQGVSFSSASSMND